MRVYGFSCFGYEGEVVTIETIFRRGIPSLDIVGIVDAQVKETRARLWASFTNAELEFPQKRVLVFAEPADIRKDTPLDFAFAASILSQSEDFIDVSCLVLGELELSGKVRSVRGGFVAVQSAMKKGISHVVCNDKMAEEIKNIPGVKIAIANNLSEITNLLKSESNFIENTMPMNDKEQVVFEELEEPFNNSILNGHYKTARALEIAAAGKHNFLLVGASGCGKTMLTQNVVPAITPRLTNEESLSTYRVYSLAGLVAPHFEKGRTPFRIPHQTATIEDMCGGGVNCHPGEISLAHNGVLFLDEATEFRTSVLQVLRVPIENKSITLSRGGRSTTYPAKFQLGLAINPCPCGNFGSKNRVCLCSAKSIELYWKKISGPLLDRIEIKTLVQKDENDKRAITLEEMRSHVTNAIKIQRKRGGYNAHLSSIETEHFCTLDSLCKDYLNNEVSRQNLSSRGTANLLKVALTIANMDSREKINIDDLKEANSLCENWGYNWGWR